MKLKLDFITNSSSTSFIVIGRYMEIKDLEPEYIKRIADKNNQTVEEATDDTYELMESLFEGTGLDHSFGEEYSGDAMMIGLPYTDMKNDETLGDFKSRVQLLILEATGLTGKPHHVEACWRDG